MGTKVFDNALDLITFSRASGGTYLDSSGVLQLASDDTPRIDYNPDGSVKGLLVEEQRTNFLEYSEDFGNSYWLNYNSNVTATNTAIAPDGKITADTITFNGTGTSINAISEAEYTLSVFLKYNNHQWILLQVSDNGSFHRARAWFDVQNGVLGTTAATGGGVVVSASIKDVGNGWYRCSITATNPVTTLYSYFPLIVTDDGQTQFVAGPSVYTWGAQLEAGAFPTSYIPTSGSTVTRAADVASIPVSAFGYNQEAGTVVVNANPIPEGSTIGNQGIVSFDNGTTNDEIILLNENNDRARLIIDPTDAGNDVDMVCGGADGSEKYAATWKVNDAQVAHGGLIGAGDTSTNPPVTITRLNVGSVPNAPLNGHIKSIQYYPRRLTNAQLQELTS